MRTLVHPIAPVPKFDPVSSVNGIFFDGEESIDENIRQAHFRAERHDELVATGMHADRVDGLRVGLHLFDRLTFVVPEANGTVVARGDEQRLVHGDVDTTDRCLMVRIEYQFQEKGFLEKRNRTVSGTIKLSDYLRISRLILRHVGDGVDLLLVGQYENVFLCRTDDHFPHDLARIPFQ